MKVGLKRSGRTITLLRAKVRRLSAPSMKIANSRTKRSGSSNSNFHFKRVCQNVDGYGVKFFASWDDMVKRLIPMIAPSSKMLVFETGQHGYKELADFLGIGVSEFMDKKLHEIEYPRTNSKEEFGFVLNLMRGFAFATVFGILLMICTCFGLFRRVLLAPPKHKKAGELDFLKQE